MSGEKLMLLLSSIHCKNYAILLDRAALLRQHSSWSYSSPDFTGVGYANVMKLDEETNNIMFL